MSKPAPVAGSPFLDIAARGPLPLAEACTKYRQIDSRQLPERHAQLCDIFEALLKLVAITVVSELAGTRQLRATFPKGLEALKHPSLGHWQSTLRQVCNIEVTTEHRWQARISQWFNDPMPPAAVTGLYDALNEPLSERRDQAKEGIRFPKGKPINEGILDTLVTYRNKVWKGHGAALLSLDSLRRRIPALESLLNQLLASGKFLFEMNLFYASAVEKLGDDVFEVKGISLIGESREAISYRYEDFDREEVYLAADMGPDLKARPIRLSPLVQWRPNAKGDYKFYFFNDTQKSSLEYLCYQDGTYYHHKDVKGRLEDVFTVSLDPDEGETDWKIRNSSEEERKQEARIRLNLGDTSMEGEKFEDAVRRYEEALQWHRSAEGIVHLCRALEALDDDSITSAYLTQKIDDALDLDPGYQPAHDLRKHLERVAREGSDKREEEADVDAPQVVVDLTLLDALVPALLVPRTATEEEPAALEEGLKRPQLPDRTTDKIGETLRTRATLLWIGLATLFFGVGGATLWFLEPALRNYNTTLVGLYLLQVLLTIFAVRSGRQLIMDAQGVLWSQIGETAVKSHERFKTFFLDYHQRMFGFITRTGSQITVNVKEERSFLIIAAIAWIALVIQIIPVQRLYDHPWPVMIIRFILTAGVFLSFIAPARFLVMSTLLIRDYAKRDLDPAVSRIGHDAFRTLSRIFTHNLFIADAYFLLLVSWNSLVCKDPNFSDLLGGVFGLVIIGFWMFMTPQFIFH